jgi:hypothetical protein
VVSAVYEALTLDSTEHGLDRAGLAVLGEQMVKRRLGVFGLDDLGSRNDGVVWCGAFTISRRRM